MLLSVCRPPGIPPRPHGRSSPWEDAFLRALTMLAIALLAIGPLTGIQRTCPSRVLGVLEGRLGGDHAGSALLGADQPASSDAIRPHDSTVPAGVTERRADGRGPTPDAPGSCGAASRSWVSGASGPIGWALVETSVAPTVVASAAPGSPRGPPRVV